MISTGTPSSPDQAILRNLAHRIDPADPAGYNNLGVLYFNKGMIEEAILAFQRALDLSPAMRVAARNLEIAYLATGHLERLVNGLGERLRVQPGDQAAKLELARAYLATGDAAQAAELLRDALRASPEDVSLIRDLARAELAAGRAREAQRLVESALTVRPKEVTLHFILGEALSAAGDRASAVRAWERAVELAPAFGDAWLRLAELLREAGDMRGSEFALRRAAELRPDLTAGEGGLSLERNNPLRYEELIGHRASRPKATNEGFLAHYHAAVALRERGLYSEAITELERAEKRGEDPPLVRQAMAELLLISGQVGAAAELYRSLTAEEESSPKLWNELGVGLHRLGKLTEAEPCYRRALSADSRYVIAANNLGVAHADQGEFVRAREYFETAAEGPHAADALCNLGLLSLRQDQRTEALAAFRAALEKEPESGAAWVGVGAILSDTDRLDEARHALARAIELRPNDAEPRYHLAFVLNRLGDLEGSLRETRLALGIDPFYAAPRFRLLVDLHYEYAEILAPDLSTSTRLTAEERVDDFAPAAEEISSIFNRIGNASQQRSTKRADYRLARSNLAKGLLDRALDEAAKAARGGGDLVEGALVTGEIFQAKGLYGEGLERFDAAHARIERRGWGDQHSAAWLGRGWCLLHMGQAEGAVEAAEVVQSRDPAAIEPRRLFAEAKLELGAYEEALSTYGELAQLLPNDPTVILRMGKAAAGAGEVGRARAAFKKALDMDPDLLAASVELGALELAAGDPAAAAAQARRALEGLPGYAEASLLLAAAEMARGRPAEATEALVDLLSDDPYNVAALVRLGEVLFAQRRLAEATTPLRRALKFDRENGLAWRLLGDANAQLGETETAAACWRRALAGGVGEQMSAATRERLSETLTPALRT